MRRLPSRCVLLLAVVAAAASVAHAESTPVRGSTDARIRSVLFHPDEVVRLVGFVGYSIDLEFEADEVFVGLSGGDLEALTYSAHTNIVTLKPKAASAAMNLAISTTKRRYYFDYEVRRERPSRFSEDVMYAVRFRYAKVAGVAPTIEEQLAAELRRAAAERPRNTNYWYCGSRSLRPTSASDDGVHTRVTFPARAELPAVFVRADDGTESLVNFTIEKDALVVHRVARRLVLRRGGLSGCIVNRSFDGGGERLSSGTVAPGVSRVRRVPR